MVAVRRWRGNASLGSAPRYQVTNIMNFMYDIDEDDEWRIGFFTILQAEAWLMGTLLDDETGKPITTTSIEGLEAANRFLIAEIAKGHISRWSKTSIEYDEYDQPHITYAPDPQGPYINPTELRQTYPDTRPLWQRRKDPRNPALLGEKAQPGQKRKFTVDQVAEESLKIMEKESRELSCKVRDGAAEALKVSKSNKNLPNLDVLRNHIQRLKASRAGQIGDN